MRTLPLQHPLIAGIAAAGLLVAMAAPAIAQDKDIAALLAEREQEQEREGGGASESGDSKEFQIATLPSARIFNDLDRGEIHLRELKQQVEIEETQAKLRELRAENPNSGTSNREILRLRREVRQLKAQIEGEQAAEAENMAEQAMSSSSVPVLANGWYVESITIAGDRRSAVLGTPAGESFEVSVGDKPRGVTVASISAHEVRVREEGETFDLPRVSLDAMPDSGGFGGGMNVPQQYMEMSGGQPMNGEAMYYEPVRDSTSR